MPDKISFDPNYDPNAVVWDPIDPAAIRWEEKDPFGPNYTEGMSTGEKFAAGVGQSAVHTGQGAKLLGLEALDMANPRQMWLSGLQTGGKARADEYRKELADDAPADAALSRTGAGLAGNMAGTVAQLVGPGLGLKIAGETAQLPALARFGSSVALPNTYTSALTEGAALGGVQPSDSLLGNAKNAAIGGAGGLLGVGAPRVVAGGLKGSKAILEPLTTGGQERVVARTLKRFQTNPNSLLNPTGEIVPGSKPTLAEATLDDGFARLEDLVGNEFPLASSRLSQRTADNNAARLGLLRSNTLNETQRADAELARSKAANPLLKTVANSTATVDSSRVLGLIDGIIGKNPMRAGIVKPLTEVREMLSGGATSPQALRSASDQIGDMITTRGPNGAPVNEHAVRELVTIKKALDGQISKAEPAFGEFKKQYRELSVPLNQADIMDAVIAKAAPKGGAVTKTGDEVVRGTTMRGLLADLDPIAAKATGFKRAKADAILSPQQKGALETVNADLLRQGQRNALDPTRGSNTAKNFIGQSILEQTVGPLGVPALNKGIIADTLQALSTGADRTYQFLGVQDKVGQLLSGAITNPAEAQRILAALNPAQRSIVTKALTQTASGVLKASAVPGGAAGVRGLLGVNVSE